MIQILSKVVIVSEWHPWELFAKDVSEVIKDDLDRIQRKDIIVEKYAGPVKYSIRPEMICRDGNLWKFINKYRPLDYAIILHNNLVTERDFQEYAKYKTKAKITNEFKRSFVQNRNVRLSYLSRKPVSESLEDKLRYHLKDWYGKSYVECEIFPHPCFDNPHKKIESSCRYFPPIDYDAIHVELFRPDKMNKQKAASYVLSLASLLLSLEKRAYSRR